MLSIKNMELPVSCVTCPFAKYESLNCQWYDSEYACDLANVYPLYMYRGSYFATPEPQYYPTWVTERRHENCPLIEILEDKNIKENNK